MGVAPSSWNFKTNNKHVISTVLKVMYQHIKIVALTEPFISFCGPRYGDFKTTNRFFYASFYIAYLAKSG